MASSLFLLITKRRDKRMIDRVRAKIKVDPIFKLKKYITNCLGT